MYDSTEKESYYDQSAKTARDSHLNSETKMLGEGAEKLRALINELHKRLQVVLRDQPETPEGNVGVPQEMLVPAADKLRNIRASVNDSAYIVQSILSRLEV